MYVLRSGLFNEFYHVILIGIVYDKLLFKSLVNRSINYSILVYYILHDDLILSTFHIDNFITTVLVFIVGFVNYYNEYVIYSETSFKRLFIARFSLFLS